MRNRILFLEIVGFVLASSLGVLMHFVYDWTSGNVLVAPFVAVNESVWEHLKLLYWPFLLTTCIGATLHKKRIENYFYYQAIALSMGLGFFLIAFYTYSGILGRSFLFVDILIFYIGYIISYRHSFYSLVYEASRKSLNYYGGILFMTYGVMLILFTFITPHLGVFQDPQTGLYGI